MSFSLIILVLSVLSPSLAQRNDVDISRLVLTALRIPQDALRAVNSIQVNRRTVQVDPGVTIEYKFATAREGANPPGGRGQTNTLILLHGAAFNADTWINRIKTVQTLAAAGFDVFAVNLPGYRGSDRLPGRSSSQQDGDFLASLVSALLRPSGRRSAVVVSPSFSGRYSFPFMTGHSELACGYIPVATGGATSIRFPNVPTLAVVGSNDPFGLRDTDHIVSTVPNSQKAVIPEGSHPAYLDDPELWHTLLYNFMSSVRCQ